MKLIYLALIAAMAMPAWAIEFTTDKDHCAAGEYSIVNPLSGGTGGLLDSTAYAETGECLKLPIEELLNATDNINVMTFKGITRIDGKTVHPVTGDGIFDITVTYEAYHSHLWCQSAQWPEEWQAELASGTMSTPDRVLITVTRVSGGDSNGAYVKEMSMLIELLRSSTAGQTSIHIRYEVEAPSQAPSDALSAITDYISRLTLGAEGKPVPGATPDPQCPYTN